MQTKVMEFEKKIDFYAYKICHQTSAVQFTIDINHLNSEDFSPRRTKKKNDSYDHLIKIFPLQGGRRD